MEESRGVEGDFTEWALVSAVCAYVPSGSRPNMVTDSVQVLELMIFYYPISVEVDVRKSFLFYILVSCFG